MYEQLLKTSGGDVLFSRKKLRKTLFTLYAQGLNLNLIIFIYSLLRHLFHTYHGVKWLTSIFTTAQGISFSLIQSVSTILFSFFSASNIHTLSITDIP